MKRYIHTRECIVVTAADIELTSIELNIFYYYYKYYFKILATRCKYLKVATSIQFSEGILKTCPGVDVGIKKSINNII